MNIVKISEFPAVFKTDFMSRLLRNLPFKNAHINFKNSHQEEFPNVKEMKNLIALDSYDMET